ncbi:MAG: M24 family metallopeptidase [Bacteroidetes bacterium]|nr:M24 family metallopeptidase [Bacteroidota bacterium]
MQFTFRTAILSLIAFFVVALPSFGQEAIIRPLPSLRDQADEQQAWTAYRVNHILPGLMEKYGVDLWVLSMREYAEDPVFWSIAAPTTFAARRRSIYLFHRREDGSVRNIALGGTSQGGVFEAYKDPNQYVAGRELWADGQWQLFRTFVEEADPGSIALNIDPVHAFADGLHSGEREALETALGPEYLERVVRVPQLAIDFIAIRAPGMEERYRMIEETVHAIIGEAFSSAVITPGSTTTDDVRWWLREKVQELGMTTWFMPSVSLQRHTVGRSEGPQGDNVIERGDLLWCDFGVIAMRLKTDTQHLGYVLREGESAPPEGLIHGLSTSNRLQDILLSKMEPGRTGNEILLAALDQMSSEGIDGTIYTHPIGDHGHGAGPLIGLWDRQEALPGRGNVRLSPNTWHSIELQATVEVPEWDNQRVSFRQEEEARVGKDGTRSWVYMRQTELHIVD